MRKQRMAALLGCSVCVASAALAADAQDYPSRPIRIIAIGPGGGSDFVARLLAPALGVNMGQQVVVENRPAGIIPGQVVAQAPPDGYTLLIGASSFMIGALLQKTPYDVEKDFTPITLATTSPGLIMVHPSLPVRSVRELIALARTRPGELNYASSGTGSSTHLAAELFKSMAAVNVVRVNYKGAGAALNDLLAGQMQLMFPTAGAMGPYIKSGRLRALAVTSAQPSALFPGMPTVAATVPGYESIQMYGIFAPARTPAAVVNRLNQEFARVLNSQDIKDRLFAIGVEAVGGSPQQLAAAVKSENARLGKVVRDAGIRAD